MKRKQPFVVSSEPKRIEFETFKPLGDYERSLWEKPNPWCFNGAVGVRRYRVVVEEVEEPRDVVTTRLQALWDASDNIHHWDVLKREAQKLGYTLTGHPGSKAPKRKSAGEPPDGFSP